MWINKGSYLDITLIEIHRWHPRRRCSGIEWIDGDLIQWINHHVRYYAFSIIFIYSAYKLLRPTGAFCFVIAGFMVYDLTYGKYRVEEHHWYKININEYYKHKQ